MSIKPIGERVVLKEIEAEETTRSGLILAGEKEEPQKAEIVATTEKGEELGLNLGAQVYYKRYAGTKVKFENQEYIIIDNDDILAVII
ncbi:MAG: co-chaperone GroES [Tissierellia bacterium]|jgi:chaperonin GroES|nr:co-chaperone GroES [Tissierellia bacterium]